MFNYETGYALGAPIHFKGAWKKKPETNTYEYYNRMKKPGERRTKCGKRSFHNTKFMSNTLNAQTLSITHWVSRKFLFARYSSLYVVNLVCPECMRSYFGPIAFFLFCSTHSELDIHFALDKYFRKLSYSSYYVFIIIIIGREPMLDWIRLMFFYLLFSCLLHGKKAEERRWNEKSDKIFCKLRDANIYRIVHLLRQSFS